MLDTHIRPRGVSDPRVLDAMMAVPRHLFVPAHLRDRAYDDRPLEIGHGQTISQPYIVALMTEMLELKPGDRVLEVGAGSGYQAAVLATLAAEIVSVERIPALAEEARARLQSLGFTRVQVVQGDGSLGYPEGAPYDAIVVTAGGPGMPEPLKEQLAEGGRLVCPVGPRDLQRLLKIVRTPDGFREEAGINCMFVPLIGREGWAGGGREAGA